MKQLKLNSSETQNAETLFIKKELPSITTKALFLHKM